jgi:glycosyltransferase involved in cell wall biosynthesis
MKAQTHTSEGLDDRIRVLQVVDKFSMDGRSIHGVARLMSWWVNMIDREHFEMSILGLRAPSRAGRYIEKQGGQVFYSDRGRLNPASLFDIAKVAQQTRADLLHLHGYKACTLGRIAGAVLGIPVILHEHGAFPSVPSYQRMADWFLAPLNDKVIVVSEAVKKFCVEKRSMSPEKVEIVLNGIPLDEFRDVPEEDVQQAAGDLGLSPDAPILGTVARLDEEKGITYLLDAIPRIKQVLPETKVLVVGDGALRSELEEKAEYLGVADDVVFTGERRDVPRLYRLMDVKVISSVYEGIPLTLFEAMASGTPVVATAVGGIGEIIEDGISGVLVQSRKPEEISEAVVRLLRDEEHRRDISNCAQDRVQKYDVRTSMRRIENIYREVLD